MTNEEISKLDVSNLSEEEARVMGIEILQDTVDIEKAKAKRTGFIAGILLAGGLIATVAGVDIAQYAAFAGGAYAASDAFLKVAEYRAHKKRLDKFTEGTYDESYKDYIKLCQDYAKKKIDSVEKIFGGNQPTK